MRCEGILDGGSEEIAFSHQELLLDASGGNPVNGVSPSAH